MKKILLRLRTSRTAKVILAIIGILAFGIYLLFNVRIKSVDHQVCYGTEGKEKLLRAEMTPAGDILMLIEERKPVVWAPGKVHFHDYVYLLKEIDQSGNELGGLYFTNEFAPRPYMEIHQVKNIHKTKDNGFLVIGTVKYDIGREPDPIAGERPDHDIWLMKLDAEGRIEWNHNGGDRQYNEYGSNAIETQNGDIILVGTGSRVESKEVRYEILRLSGEDGTLIWRQFYPISWNHDHYYGSIEISETASEDFYILGKEPVDEWVLDHNIYLTKFDRWGSLIWEKGIGKSSGSGYGGLYRASMDLINEEEPVIVCHTDNSEDFLKEDIWAARINTSGEYKWAEFIFEKTRLDTYATSIEVTKDNSLIIAGYMGDWRNRYQDDVWTAEMSEFGELHWKRFFGGSKDDKARAIFQAPSGHFVLVGTTESNNGDVSGNHGYEDVWYATF